MVEDALGTAKHSVGKCEAVTLVRRLGLRPALPQNARQIFVSEKGISSSVLPGSKRQEFFDVRGMRRRLVGLQRCITSYSKWRVSVQIGRAAAIVQTGDRSVVFNSIMQANLLQVKRIFTIAFAQRAGGVMAHIVAKRRAKIERRMDMFGNVGELDASSTAWDNS